MKKYYLKRETWKPGISDGLTLSCGICGCTPKFDYIVDDTFWKEVAPEKDRLGVICLPCLDKLASDQGLDISTYLESVQFTGIGKTIELLPHRVFYYEQNEAEQT